MVIHKYSLPIFKCIQNTYYYCQSREDLSEGIMILSLYNLWSFIYQISGIILNKEYLEYDLFNSLPIRILTSSRVLGSNRIMCNIYYRFNP